MKKNLIALALGAALAAPHLHAADFYWAPSTGAGGNGDWNTSDAFWAPNSDGTGTKTIWNNTPVDNDAVFGGTAGTVSVVTGVNTNRLTFAVDGYTLGGASTITLNGSAPVFEVASGSTANVSAVIGSTASGNISFQGGGTLILTGANTFSNQLNLNAGEFRLGSGGVVNLGSNSIFMGQNSNDGNLLRIDSGGSLSVSNLNLVNGDGRRTGTVTQNGGTVTVSSNLMMSSTGGVGNSGPGWNATYNMNGGNLAVVNILSVGRNGAATFNHSGGVTNLTRTFDALQIGDYAEGSFNLTGGTVNAVSGTLSSTRNLLIGHRGGDGTLTINGAGAELLVRGTGSLANNDSSTTGSTATVNLQEGTLAINGLTRGSGTGTVNFNLSGGTLRPYDADFIVGSSTAANNFDIVLSGSGSEISGIDAATSTDREVTIHSALTGSGSITFNGGTIRLMTSNSFGGDATVSSGSLILESGASMTNAASIHVSNGATLNNSSLASVDNALSLQEGAILAVSGSGSAFGPAGVTLSANLADGFDLIDVGSFFTKGGELSFDLTGISEGTYSLFSSAPSGAFDSVSIGASALFSGDGGNTFSGAGPGGFTYTFSNLDNTLAVIPEPSVYTLLLGAMAVGLASLRRRRRN